MAVAANRFNETILAAIDFLEKLAGFTETIFDDNVVALLRVISQSEIMSGWLQRQTEADVPDGAVRVMTLTEDEAAEARRLEISAEQLEWLVPLLPVLSSIFGRLFR